MEPYPPEYPKNLTWESLFGHIENLISVWGDFIQSILKEKRHLKVISDWENKLNHMRWYLPLVSEAQKRDKLQVLIPYFGVGEIYLIYRSQQKDLISLQHAFAMISSVADGMYRLQEINNFRTYETAILLKGNRFQILDMVEKLVDNIRVREQA